MFAAKVSKHFDFEGSMIENIERFCRSFTGEFTVRCRVYRLDTLSQFASDLKPVVKKLLKYK